MFVQSLLPRRLSVTFLLLCLLAPSIAGADSKQTDDYIIPADVIVVGGGEKGRTDDYLLDDSIGEPNIGPGTSAEYGLGAGYRQMISSPFLSMSCSSSVTLPAITATGQSTGSGTCLIITDADAGYSLSWGVLTGSGGTNTGSLVSSGGNTIDAYTPAANGTPETWSVGSSAAEWGGRLKSASTDTAVRWGTENGGDKWLNIPAESSASLVTRSSRTSVAGSTEIFQLRTEIGSGVTQAGGSYGATVTFTVVSL